MSNHGYTTESDDEQTMTELREMQDRELAAEAAALVEAEKAEAEAAALVATEKAKAEADKKAKAKAAKNAKAKAAKNAKAKAARAKAKTAKTAEAEASANERTSINKKLYILDKKVLDTKRHWEEISTQAEANPGDNNLAKRSNTARLQHELAKRTNEFYLGKLAELLV